MSDPVDGLLPTKPSATETRGLNEALLFFCFLALGFAAIVGMKLWGFNTTLVTTLSVFSMIAYGAIASLLPTVRLRPDKLGDNLYYMGFVFTLASMSTALVQLRGGADPLVLIDSFGIALFTTIAGIIGRVICLQFRSEVEDAEEQVKMTLLDAATTLRARMTAAQHQFSSFQRGVEASLDDILKRSADAFQANLSEANAAFEKGTKGYLENLAAYSDKILGEAKSNSEAYREIGTGLKNGASRTIAALNDLPARLDAIQIPSDLVDAKFKRTFEGMERAVRQFEENAKIEGERFASMTEASRGLAETVNHLQSEMERLSGLSNQAATVASGSESLRSTLSQTSSTIQATSETFRALIGDLNTSLSDVLQKQRDVQVRQTAASETFTTTLAEVNSRLEDFKTSLAMSDTDLKTAAKDFNFEVTQAATVMREAAGFIRESIRSHDRSGTTASHSPDVGSRSPWNPFRRGTSAR